MKALIYIAAHYAYSSENPLFLELCKALIDKGHSCFISLPHELKYLQLPKSVSRSYYHPKTRSENDGFFKNLNRIVSDKHVNAAVPLTAFRELAWRPDTIFVFSDPFQDFEFYTNTWLYNVFNSKGVQAIKICQHQPVYANSISNELKEKHIDSLPFFKRLFFINESTKRRTERQLAQTLKAEVLPRPSASFYIEPAKHSLSKTMICPFPSTCSIYMQSLIIQVWHKVFAQRTDVTLCLNTFGKDVDFLRSYAKQCRVHIAWKTTEEMLKLGTSGILLLNSFLELYEYKNLLEQDDMPVLSNVHLDHKTNPFHIPGATFNNLVEVFKKWDESAPKPAYIRTYKHNWNHILDRILESI